MQYFDLVTNPRWRTAAILKIVKSSYLTEQELIAIANRSRVSCAHNTSKATIVNPWPWNLG